MPQHEQTAEAPSQRQRLPMLLSFAALAVACAVGLLAPALLGADLLDGLLAICRFPR